jgi:HEAT repeat protein
MVHEVPAAPDHDATVRHRAAVLAGYEGDPSTAREHLRDPHPRVRAAALGALSRCDDLDAATLREALTDPDAGVRRRAITLAVDRPDVDLLASLTDPDDTVIEQAAWACGERPVSDAAVLALAELAVAHDEPLVREAAVAALGSLGDVQGLDAILHACADRAPVRRRAVIALAPFDTPAVRDALRAARTDRDWQVRQSAEDLATIMSIDDH